MEPLSPSGSAKRSRASRQNARPARAGKKRRPHWKRGEDLAAEYLEHLGYQILARNWRSPLTRNEIDLIARDGNCIVFVEVKSARSRQFGEPLSWITPRKQGAIIRAALAYLSQSEATATDFRFDAIAIAPSQTTGRPTIDHVCSAFTCDVMDE